MRSRYDVPSIIGNAVRRQKERLIGRFKRSAPVRLIADRYERRHNPDIAVSPSAGSGWSFVIVTDGSQSETLKACVGSIVREMRDPNKKTDRETKGEDEKNWEIVLVGPAPLTKLFSDPYIRVLPYRELGIAPGWITRKKNFGVRMSRYNTIVLLHDYVALEPGWLKGFGVYGKSFEVCMTPMINKDGSRFKDWTAWDHPDIGFGLLPYEVEDTAYQFVSGTYFIVKRDFYLEFPLDEERRWGEAEDVEWSKRVRQHTTFRLNPHSQVRLLKQKRWFDDNWRRGSCRLTAAFPSPEMLALRETLRQEIRLLSPGENTSAKEEWSENLVELRRDILEKDLRNFISWPVIQKTMFHVSDDAELRAIERASIWKEYRAALAESWIGDPPPYPAFLNSSGNRIHQLYNLHQLIDSFSVNFRDVSSIFEFGGGYGSLCSVAHCLGFTGTYTIFDFPEFNALQRYYLSLDSLTGIRFESSISQAVSGPVDLFIAAWSLSESPVELRERILAHIGKPAYMLIAYQKEFCGIDNRAYFAGLKKRFANHDWKEYEIPHLRGNFYLIGKKTDRG